MRKLVGERARELRRRPSGTDTRRDDGESEESKAAAAGIVMI